MNGYKTYIGILIALVPSVANLFGYSVSPAFSDEFTQSADSFMQIVGLIIALYGRLVATSPGWFAKQ